AYARPHAAVVLRVRKTALEAERSRLADDRFEIELLRRTRGDGEGERARDPFVDVEAAHGERVFSRSERELGDGHDGVGFLRSQKVAETARGGRMKSTRLD